MIDLLVLQHLATRLGAVDIAERTRALTQRLAEGRFYVACIGQFKRGKSTLLNALVGDPILPTGVVPVTSVVTVLRYGERAARVKAGGSWTPCDPSHLADFVSEDQNPGNRLAVEAVEVFVPCQLLAGGMCLVDTPGVGSVFEDVLGSFKGRVASVDRDAAVYLRQLLRVNSARSRNDFEERVLESRRRLERELRARLDAVTATAERALQAAEASSTAGGAAVAAQLDDLRLIESDLVSFEGQVDATQSMDGQE
jgi:hypothetical protein